MNQRWQLLALCVVVAILIATPLCGAEDHPSWCGAENLDVRVLPPFQSKTSPRAHLLVITFKNRSQAACSASLSQVKLLPEPVNRTWNSIWMYSYAEDSEAARQFQARQRTLSPDEEAHVLVAWSSSPALSTLYDCTSYDTLIVDNVPLRVHGLHMQACGEVFVSLSRLGSFVPGELIPPRWMQRLNLSPQDFIPQSPLQPQAVSASAPLVALRSLYDVQFVPGYFELMLKTSHLSAQDCPFNMLRKRESSGATAIYLAQCDDSPAAPLVNASQTLRAPGKEIRIELRTLELLPEKPGKVEYEVTSRVPGQDPPAWVSAATPPISVRDPEAPQLPVIATSVNTCTAKQLQLTGEPIRLGKHWAEARNYAGQGEEWHDAMGYEFTNASTETCLIGGAPELRYLNPPGESGFIKPDVCRNCPTSLYQPRESRWIELKPNDSAHFFLARTVFDQNYWWYCTIIARLELALSGHDTIPLPLNAGSCGQVRVSAWREGRYDNDPMNLKYREVQLETSVKPGAEQLARDCAGKGFGNPSRSIEFPAYQGVLRGFSIEPAVFAFGAPIPVRFWFDNSTGESVDDYIFGDPPEESLNVYDSLGRRVLSWAEVRKRNIPRPAASPDTTGFALRRRNSDQDIPRSGNAIIIPPYTCFGGDAASARNLADAYTLPPGRYVVLSPSIPASDRSDRISTEELTHGLMITVEPQ